MRFTAWLFSTCIINLSCWHSVLPHQSTFHTNEFESMQTNKCWAWQKYIYTTMHLQSVKYTLHCKYGYVYQVHFISNFSWIYASKTVFHNCHALVKRQEWFVKTYITSPLCVCLKCLQGTHYIPMMISYSTFVDGEDAVNTDTKVSTMTSKTGNKSRKRKSGKKTPQNDVETAAANCGNMESRTEVSSL